MRLPDGQGSVMTVESKGRTLAKAFDIATGYFEIGALLTLDGRWQGLDKIRILMGAETTHRTRKTMLEAVRAQALDRLDESRHSLRRKGMFVAQVVGKSMEPAIRDSAWCLFRAPVEGTRQGKIVLVQLRDATDPETGQRYTVKRYRSERAKEGDSWRHVKITLKPVNPDFEPIVLSGADEGKFQVVAELVEVLGS